MSEGSIRPTVLLYTARGLRDFGDGFVSVLLPVYLTGLGFSPFEVGVIATAALLGSALITFGVGLVGARFDPRQLLLLAAGLMLATGMAFVAVHDYVPLLLVAFIGTVNPTAGTVSIFVPLEHAVLAREVLDRERTAAFARYSFVGAIAGAAGAFAAATPDLVARAGIDQLTGIKLMFGLYALLGLAGGLIYACIPRHQPSEHQPAARALGPSRGIVTKLAAVFSLDAFAGGFIVQSLMALWLFEQFQLSLAAASAFFFCSGMLSAVSFPVAVWLSRRIGLVRTMVYTHFPSNICLILAVFTPNLKLVLALLLVRAFLSQMDVPARSSYVMAVVTPSERAAAASFTSVPRSLASAASPVLAGALFAATFRGWPLLISGVLKIIYDVLLLVQFRHVRPPEEL